MKKLIYKTWLRVYLIPALATLIALIFWWHFRHGGYLWWIILIGGILVINIWSFIGSRKNFKI